VKDRIETTRDKVAATKGLTVAMRDTLRRAERNAIHAAELYAELATLAVCAIKAAKRKESK
jgi:hypothetical protein